MLAEAGAAIASSILGGISDNKNWSRQKKMAQNQIQWRVADAKAAGVHPLYALGAPTMSFSPSGYDGGASSMSALGQDISRAKMAAMDRREREAAATMALAESRERLALERMRTEAEVNESAARTQMLQSQVARNNSAQLGPPMPASAGSLRPDRTLPTDLVQPRVSDPIQGAATDPARQPGVLTDYQFARRANGNLFIVPSEEIKERIEDNLPGELGWMYRNNFLPMIGQPPPAPPGYRFNWMIQEYEPIRNRRRSRPQRRSSYSQRPGNF